MTVGVLTGSDAQADAAAGLVEVMPLVDHWSLSRLFLLIRSVSRWKPDLIHIQYPTKGYGRCKLPVFLPFIFGR